MSDKEYLSVSNVTRQDRLDFLEYAVNYKGRDCLIWPYGLKQGGYPQIWMVDRMYTAHRLVFIRVFGPLANPSNHVCHRCGKPDRPCLLERFCYFAMTT